MSRPQKRAHPPARAGAHVEPLRKLYGSNHSSHSARLPVSWREHQPNPARYYAAHVARLGSPNAAGWAQGTCPFHDDRNASLSVHLSGRGLWRCFAGCGGGDLVGFHMRLTGQPFKQAVADLLRGGA